MRFLASTILVGSWVRRFAGEAGATASNCTAAERCESADGVELAVPNRIDFVHPAQDPDLWELTFEDRFDGTELASESWQTRFPWGRDRSTVGELQWYVRDDLDRADHFQVSDGRLRIVADRCVLPSDVEIEQEYCSGLISTYDTFAQEFGYFEIRARVPFGQGLWPAFWLLPLDVARDREIDVVEILGDDPTTVHMNVHYVDEDDRDTAISGSFSGPDFSLDYHTFAVSWTAERIVWYVDGMERHRVNESEAVPSGLFYLIANLAVGGEWPGDPDETTSFPAYLDIDYIRVYQRRS